jgi:glycosyltransferase involved in cell wall biosynthesis
LTPNAAVLYGGRKVVTVHDLTLLDYDTSHGSRGRRALTKLKRAPFRLIFRRQLATATHVVTVTDYVKRQLVERFDIDGTRVSTAWLAADSEHLNHAEEESVPGVGPHDICLLYVGNYYPYKNVKAVIEALGLVGAVRRDVKLVLAGRADDFKSDLLTLVKALGLTDRVLMPGFVTDGQLKWLYRHCTIFINPSLSEGFGLQGLEAMSQGLPVIASRASCLPEVYGDAAVYFEPSNARELSDRITELLDEPGRLSELSARGRDRMSMFSWRRTAAATHQVYTAIEHNHVPTSTRRTTGAAPPL